jgi:Fur family transcriptional regulator, ferric uptake regulator
VPDRAIQSVKELAEAAFREYLRDRGLKYTPPRRAILEAVMANTEHFEAEQLLLDLRQRGDRVARATIYRTLPILVNCGVLKAVRLGEKMVHYEQAFGADPHDHMICQRCGRIIEFDGRDVLRLRTVLAERYHFHDIAHRFQIMGTCKKCIESLPIASRPFVASSRKPSKERRKSSG